MYAVKVKATQEILAGFMQGNSMNGVGITNVVNCPEMNYTASELEEIEIDDAGVQSAMDAHQAKVDTANPLKKWEKDIKASDRTMLPRYLEDHIRDDHGGVAGNAQLQAKYDAKVALRNTKP